MIVNLNVRTRPGSPAAGSLVTISRPMQEVVSAARDVAETDATVLLLGERGTGKKTVARFIHDNSTRARGPWVVFKCAGLPPEALTRELLGSETQTGAQRQGQQGQLEQARGGTLLIDEVADMSLELQTKLLRILQDRQVQRVDGERAVSIDVRIIATSSRDLKAEVVAGRFRADLYYRLCVFPIVVPPLRARQEDVHALSLHFVDRLSRDMGRPAPALSAAALAALNEHAFEGNACELRNVIERALIRCRQPVVHAQDLNFDPPFPHGTSCLDLGQRTWALPIDLNELERLAIGEALRRVRGNRTHAARLLGISLRTLRNKLRMWRQKGDDSGGGVDIDVMEASHDSDTALAQPSQSKAEEQAA